MSNTRHKNTNDPQKKYRLPTVSKNILLEGVNRFHGANREPDQVWCSVGPDLGPNCLQKLSPDDTRR